MSSTNYSSLNDLLGRELGRNPYSDPVFSWRNSDTLFWPAFRTGRSITRTTTSDIPVIGSSLVERVTIDTVVPEYRQDRQVRLPNTWYVCKWLNPEQLIWGWFGRYGGEAVETTPRPTQAQLEELWNRQFPGADFPHQGWRIPTDAYLPRWLGGEREPNERDTLHFIAQVREQTRWNFDERLADMLAAEDAVDAAKDKRIADEVRDSFPAFLNPAIGKRSSFVSFPWSRKDRQQ